MLFSVSKENNLTYFSLRSLGMIVPEVAGAGAGVGRLGVKAWDR